MPEVTSRTLPSGKEVQRMISPEAVKVYETIRNTPKQVDLDLFHQREAGEHQEDMTSEPQGVTYEEPPRWGPVGNAPDRGQQLSDHVPVRWRVRDLLAPLASQDRRTSRERVRGTRASSPILTRSGAPLPGRGRRRGGRLSVAVGPGVSYRACRHRGGLEWRRPDDCYDAQAA